MNNDLEQFKAKHRERMEKLSPEELAAAVSRNMMCAEIGIQLAAEQLCERAGEDRLGADARAMIKTMQALYGVKGAHALLSEIQADVIGAPIARSGER